MKAASPLDLGLVGCGRAAERLYAPALSALPSVRLVAVADPSPDRREVLTAATGAGGFPDLTSLLRDADVEGIVITAPPNHHEALVAEALEAGLPALVEKPLTPTVDAGLRLLEIARGRAPVLVGFNRRRLAAVTRLRKILARDPGPLHFTSHFHALPDVWAPVAGVPPVLDDLATHHLDLLLHLADAPPDRVRASEAASGSFVVEVELVDGSQGRIHVSQGERSQEWVEVGRGRERWEIRSGSDRLRPVGGLVRTLLDRAASVGRKLGRRPHPLVRSITAQLRAFEDCVRHGAEPSPGIEEGMVVVRVVDAARRSAEAGGETVELAGA